VDFVEPLERGPAVCVHTPELCWVLQSQSVVLTRSSSFRNTADGGNCAGQ